MKKYVLLWGIFILLIFAVLLGGCIVQQTSQHEKEITKKTLEQKPKIQQQVNKTTFKETPKFLHDGTKCLMSKLKLMNLSVVSDGDAEDIAQSLTYSYKNGANLSKIINCYDSIISGTASNVYGNEKKEWVISLRNNNSQIFNKESCPFLWVINEGGLLLNISEGCGEVTSDYWVIDVTGDKKEDIIYMSQWHSVSTYFNRFWVDSSHSGDFKNVVTSKFGWISTVTTSLSFEDYNEDGIADLKFVEGAWGTVKTANSPGGSVNIYSWNGTTILSIYTAKP